MTRGVVECDVICGHMDPAVKPRDDLGVAECDVICGHVDPAVKPRDDVGGGGMRCDMGARGSRGQAAG